MRYLNIWLFSLIVTTVLAQSDPDVDLPDKIYLSNGAMLKVKLLPSEKEDKGQRIIFRNQWGKVDTLSPTESSGYWFNGNFYSSQKLIFPDTSFTTFVKRTVYKGRNFYKYEKEGKDYFFIALPGAESMLMLSDSAYKQQLSTYFKEEEDRAKFLQSTYFKPRSLSAAIDRFQKKDYRPFFRTTISLETGLVSTRTLWREPQFGDRVFENVTSYGAGLQVVAPIQYGPVAVGTGLFFNWFDMLTALDEEDTVQYSFRYNEFRLPLSLRYTFSRNKLKPYLGAGLSYGFRTNASFRALESATPDSSFSRNLVEEEVIAKNSFAFHALMGMAFKINTRRHVYIESRYFYQISRRPLRQTSFQVVLGMDL